MSEFRLESPIFLVLLLLPVAILLIPQFRAGLKSRFQMRQSTLTYSDTRLLIVPDVRSWRLQLAWIPNLLRGFAWVLLVIVLARPQAGSGTDIIRGQGVDIVLAVDISTSMAALDFEPQNRLETAKSVISEFITGREFDRIGLVVFARNAYHQAPLTLDYPILLDLLDEVQLVSGLRQIEGRQLDGTALGLGIASSTNMLRSSTAPSKVIILLTDGDNNAGLDPLTAAIAAQTLGIRIYTIGMGTTGTTTIPNRDGGFDTMESDLNEPLLENISTQTEGLYFRAENTRGLQQIYGQIDLLERSDVERRIFIRWQDRAVFPLLLALVCLVIERILRLTVFQQIP